MADRYSRRAGFFEEGDKVRIILGQYAGKIGIVDAVKFVRHDIALYQVAVDMGNGDTEYFDTSSNSENFELVKE
jgi:hypothetical protein